MKHLSTIGKPPIKFQNRPFPHLGQIITANIVVDLKRIILFILDRLMNYLEEHTKCERLKAA